MDDRLVGYLIDALDPAERAEVEDQVRSCLDTRRRLELLRVALAPLLADRAEPAPPPGIVERTLARIAEYMPSMPRGRARLRVAVAGSEPVFQSPRWRWADALVAAGILLLVGGMGSSGIARVQHQYANATCQNHLRQFGQAFASYADANGGAFPRVQDQPPRNVAAAFVPILAQGGFLPERAVLACPVQSVAAGQPGVTPAAGYAYTLGYRDASGRLHGLRREPGDAGADVLPIMADVAAPAGHRLGQNVLYTGGYVRFCTTTRAGVDRDEIYRNQRNRAAAGVHWLDTSLADGDTCP